MNGIRRFLVFCLAALAALPAVAADWQWVEKSNTTLRDGEGYVWNASNEEWGSSSAYTNHELLSELAILYCD